MHIISFLTFARYLLGFLFSGSVTVQQLSPFANHQIGFRLIESARVGQRVVIGIQISNFVGLGFVLQIFSFEQIVYRVEPESVNTSSQPVQQRVL